LAAARGAQLAAAVDDFLASAAALRGLSPATLEAYGRDLARLLAFLEGEGVSRPGQLGREHVTAFAVALERDGLGARSRARALVAARRFLRHLGAEGLLRGDPWQGTRLPRFERPLPRVLRADETATLIESVDQQTPLALRDRAGATARRLSLLDALVWTYCDGRHDARAIARHVSAALPEAGDDSAIESTVASLLAQLAREGMVA